MVFISLNFSILITKVPQDLTFIRRMSGAMNETGFQFSLRAIYILFSELARALTSNRVSLSIGGLPSLIPAVTSTVGIFPGRFFTRRFYYTFVTRFYYFHTLKYVNRFLEGDRFVIKAMNIGLFRPAIRHDV